jgi:hypothetical protein
MRARRKAPVSSLSADPDMTRYGVTEVTASRWAIGPSPWLADDIDSDSYVLPLTPDDLQVLDAALRQAIAAPREASGLSTLKFSPGGLADSLAQIKRRLERGVGFCILRGLPVERYTVRELKVILFALGAQLGRVMPQSSAGELCTHIQAVPGQSARGYQNGGALPFHSDSCDIVGLLCLCPARLGGESAIASTYAIHNALLQCRPDLLSTLYQSFHIDRHGEQPSFAPPYYATPVFMWHDGRLFSRFNPGYIRSAQRYPQTPRLTSQQVDAINIFEQLCWSDPFRLDMSLRAGDLQLLNNNCIVHARHAYEDDRRPNRRRHLLRIWLFTSSIEGVPAPMRERYRDMESWYENPCGTPPAEA